MNSFYFSTNSSLVT